MATTPILNLPSAIGLDGTEQVPLIAGLGANAIAERASVAMIAAYSSSPPTSNQAANKFYGGPSSGAAALPVFRVLAPADLPGNGISSFAIGDLPYASSATALSSLADVAVGSVLVSGGVATAPAYSRTPTLGASGTLGTLSFGNATSGTVKLQPVAGALGSAVLSVPAATDTLVGKATTDTLTNKTYDTAGTGNVFKINGTGISAVTGTGSAVLNTSPTFSGTVALGVATATTINNVTLTTPATAATLTIANNKTLAVNNTMTLAAGADSQTFTFPSASDTVAGIATAQALSNKTLTLTAGTTSVQPLTFTSGTLNTSAVAGVEEYDGVQKSFTIDTSSGRGAIPVEQYFHLTADGSTISTIANFFGSTSNITLVASGYYIIEIVLFFLKTTADTVVWTLTNSAAPTSQNIYYEASPITGIVAPPGTATALVGQIYNDATAAKTITTGTLSTAVNHYVRMRIWLQNGTGTSLKIQATATSGTITPHINSYWFCRRVSPSNFGTFTA